MPEPRPPMVEVIEDLTADYDGSGQDWQVVDGPHVFPDRVVAYVRQSGTFRDTLRVQVTVHEAGERREAAQRYKALPSLADEFTRVQELIGQPVRLRGGLGQLRKITHIANVGIEVEVEWINPATGDRLPYGTGWSLDVSRDHD